MNKSMVSALAFLPTLAALAVHVVEIDHPVMSPDEGLLLGNGDLQGLSDDARQIIVALMSAEILQAAASKTEPIRPCFLVFEEGHNFAPSVGQSISRAIVKRIAGEGRKFGVGFAVISQRPSKLDPDVTSQCNTLITMRIKNPEDQRFIAKSTEQLR